MGSAQVICAEMRPWRAGDVRAAAGHSGRGRKCQGSSTAVRLPASVSAGAAGNGPSARAMPIIARTRHGPSVPGRKAIASTGASIGEPTRTTASATATDPGSGDAIAGSVRVRRPQSLQRWTRRCRVRPCRQELIGSSRRRPRSLQRWTRGWWKSLWYQHRTGRWMRFAKRGRDRGGGAVLLALPAWTPSAWILICIAWSCALRAPAWWSRARWSGSPARSSAGARLSRALRWPIPRRRPVGAVTA